MAVPTIPPKMSAPKISAPKVSAKGVMVLPWLVCAIGAAFYSYEYLLRILPGLMANELLQFYGIGAAALGNLVAYYYYAYIPMQFPVGVLMDRFNPKYLLALACAICAAGSLLSAGISEHIYLAKLGRLCMGFGSAFAFVGVLKLAAIWLPAERFALVVGLATALGMVGAMVGDVSLTLVIAQYGWQHVFMLFVILGASLAVIILLTPKQGAVVAPAPVALTSTDKLSSSLSPLAPQLKWCELLRGFLQILRNPQILLVGIIGCFLFMSLSVFADFWGISYLQRAYHFSATQAASAVAMIFLGWAVGAPIAGWVSDRLQKRVILLVVGSLVAAAAITTVLYYPGLPAIAVYPLLFIYGAFCATEIVVFAIGREKSPDNLSGTAIAVVNMLVMLCGALFIPLAGLLLEYFWSGTMGGGIPYYSVDDYRWALSFLPLGLLAAAGLAFLVKEGSQS